MVLGALNGYAVIVTFDCRIRSARTEADQLETEADQMLDEKAQIVESIQKLLLSNRNAVLQLQRILPSGKTHASLGCAIYPDILWSWMMPPPTMH